ncbi:hypothetical protein B0H17DRAFT_1150289 [Mycena rosella]|uniref:Uncharacterized protein n=1 Tax=Mycena rosella TaxID=1033263 RepID=A0AAD7BWG2_MYCRO|nr:hypothetical protein B0H17DRAFT_1150289 [Mycena rosella]
MIQLLRDIILAFRLLIIAPHVLLVSFLHPSSGTLRFSTQTVLCVTFKSCSFKRGSKLALEVLDKCKKRCPVPRVVFSSGYRRGEFFQRGNLQEVIEDGGDGGIVEISGHRRKPVALVGPFERINTVLEFAQLFCCFAGALDDCEVLVEAAEKGIKRGWAGGNGKYKGPIKRGRQLEHGKRRGR